MSRTLLPNTLMEIDKRVTYPIELVSFDIGVNADDESQNLYLSTGYKDIIFNNAVLNIPANTTFTPGSSVVGFSAIEETRDIKTNSINVDLNGVPNTIIAALEGVNGQAIGGIVTIYQAFWNEETGRLLGTTTAPEIYQKWQGIINSFSTTEENQPQGTVKISVECKSSIGTLLDTKSGRYTSNASIQSITGNEDDISMEFVPSLIDWNPNFGAEE